MNLYASQWKIALVALLIIICFLMIAYDVTHGPTIQAPAEYKNANLRVDIQSPFGNLPIVGTDIDCRIWTDWSDQWCKDNNITATVLNFPITTDTQGNATIWLNTNPPTYLLDKYIVRDGLSLILSVQVNGQTKKWQEYINYRKTVIAPDHWSIVIKDYRW